MIEKRKPSQRNLEKEPNNFIAYCENGENNSDKYQVKQDQLVVAWNTQMKNQQIKRYSMSRIKRNEKGQFEKGTSSPNPNGRPKGSITKQLKHFMNEIDTGFNRIQYLCFIIGIKLLKEISSNQINIR